VSLIGRLRNVIKYGVGPQARDQKVLDKRQAKLERFESSDAWERSAGFAHRHYASYDEYLAHQSSKLEGIIDRLRETDAEEFEEFRARFADCAALRGAHTVLCLAARLGGEVRALHSLGYFAVGIDLEPGPDNPYVLHGDFHRLVFPDASVDAVYCNALDHVFDLDRMIGEVARVLRPGGCFLAEIDEGYGAGSVPGDFEALHWQEAGVLIERVAKLGKFEVEEARSLGRMRRGLRRLVTLRKPG
jgi:SAM-dependent methyltransferase